MVLLLWTLYLVIIGTVKFLSWTIKTASYFAKFSVCDDKGKSNFKVASTNCFIFGKNLPSGNRGSANFQVASSKLPYFCKDFSS